MKYIYINILILFGKYMLTFKPISVDNLLEYIEVAFMDDVKLCQVFHIENSSSSSLCAKHTHSRIIEATKSGLLSGMVIYGIEDEDSKIGYICLVKNQGIMYSFGLNNQYRNEEVKQLLINFAKLELNNNISVYLYGKNMRAITFLKRNNFKEVLSLFEDNEPVIKLQLCQ